MEREHNRQELKTGFVHYFTCYSGPDTQGSQEFIPTFHLDDSIWLRYQMIIRL